MPSAITDCARIEFATTAFAKKAFIPFKNYAKGINDSEADCKINQIEQIAETIYFSVASDKEENLRQAINELIEFVKQFSPSEIAIDILVESDGFYWARE